METKRPENYNVLNWQSITIKGYTQANIGRRGGLMVSALVHGSSGPGSSPGRGHCCVLGQETLLSQCLSPPRSINGYRRFVGET